MKRDHFFSLISLCIRYF